MRVHPSVFIEIFCKEAMCRFTILHTLAQSNRHKAIYLLKSRVEIICCFDNFALLCAHLLKYSIPAFCPSLDICHIYQIIIGHGQGKVLRHTISQNIILTWKFFLNF